MKLKFILKELQKGNK